MPLATSSANDQTSEVLRLRKFSSSPHKTKGLRRRTVIWLCGLGLAAPVVVEAGRVLLGSNFHEVLPGQLYRGAQPSGASLAAMVEKYHIKTVVNVRGCGNPAPWYLEECRAAQKHDLNLEDVCLSSGRMPPAHEIRRLVEILDQAETPIYLHCWRGADRTGIAATMALLLRPDISFAEARRQLGLRYGHVAMGRPANLDSFFDVYEYWLKTKGLEHSADQFRHWACNEYQGGWLSYAIEKCERTTGPAKRGEPLGYAVRLRNTGIKSLHFARCATAGVHLGYQLRDSSSTLIDEGQFGHLEAEVKPGETIDLMLVVSPIQKAGRYRLLIDLIESQHCWLYQAGAEPWEEELDIRE